MDLSEKGSDGVVTPTVAAALGFAFDNSYARLPDRFYARLAPTPVRTPRLVRLNRDLAHRLGLDPERLATEEGVAALAGNALPEGAEPLAMAYAGHQFGGWVPQLGDGRAILLGEVVDRDGRRRDVQLKGSGRTPFSRMGDGRAALGPVLREYIVSEAMAALEVPTTRALAAVTTGEYVLREHALPGAVLTRVAESHIRVGTFQFFASRDDVEALRLLADHVIGRHYPDAAGADQPYRALLAGVVDRQAKLVAQWLLIGFIHGVMNTDNMSIAGETIDYGPCAFMDTYHPATVFSSIDQHGRYAFGNQPRIAHWNLACLAQALLPLLGVDEATAMDVAQSTIDAFSETFENAFTDGLRRKIGLLRPLEDDLDLGRDLLLRMADGEADFTLTFRQLSALGAAPGSGDEAVRALFKKPESFDVWAQRWRTRLASETASEDERRAVMRTSNPAFIPRNQRVEAALEAAVERGDLGPFDALMTALARPYDDQPERAHLAHPPGPEALGYRTFCGT